MNIHHGQAIYLLGGRGQQSFSYQKLIQRFHGQGEFLSPDSNAAGLSCYEQDSQHVHLMRPLLVFRPFHLSIISSFISVCYELDLPVTPRCGGSGLVGGAVASQGGIVLLTGHFRSIISYNKEQGIISVEPGVTPKQINAHVEKDGWYFPLEMASNGIAGLAGCLSSQAKGYHQANDCLTHNIQSITLINGKGDQTLAAAALFCGAEGTCGVITQLNLQLIRKPAVRKVIQYTSCFEELLTHVDGLVKFSAIVSIVWSAPQEVVVVLEGDQWQVDAAMISLQSKSSEIRILSSDWILDIKFPPRHSSFLISNGIKLSSVPKVLASLKELSEELEIHDQSWINVLEQTIHILLFSTDSEYDFLKKLERWLVQWVHVLQNEKGVLICRHGRGPFLRHYTPPFYREEDLLFLKQLLLSFDDKRLFSRDRFFPTEGKSLEKVVK